MNNYRLLSIISPSIEKEIIENNTSLELLRFLEDTISIIQENRSLICLLIPIELISYFKFGILRLLYDKINKSQSNVIFYSRDITCHNSIMYINQSTIEYHNAKQVFLEQLLRANMPQFIDLKKNIIEKKECIDTECASNICCRQVFTVVTNSEIASNIEDIVKYLIEANYDDKIFLFKEINSESIKNILYVICKYHNIEDRDFLKYENVKYCEEALVEINKADLQMRKNILFSLFRAIVYPTSQAPDRKKFSIDIHPNNPAEKNGYKLRRIDVVNENQTGRCNSGKLRLLLGIKGYERKLIAFTSEHDFSASVYNRI